MKVEYLHLKPQCELPNISSWKPFRAALLIEDAVNAEWRTKVSEWLVNSGCLYMAAWGIDCSDWDDSVDFAVVEKFNYGEVPDSEFVITTWHEDETMSDALFFLKNAAKHPEVDMLNTVLIHISTNARKDELLAAYETA